MPVCAACNKIAKVRLEGATCIKCAKPYHRACVGLTATPPADWCCPECKRFLPRDNKAETPVKGMPAQTEAGTVDVGAATCRLSVTVAGVEDACRDRTQVSPMSDISDLSAELRLMREEMKVLRDEMRQCRQEMSEFRSTVQECKMRIDSIEQRVEIIEKRVTDAVATNGTAILEKAISNLQMELQDRDQDFLCNDIQISNITEAQGENPVHVAVLVAKKLGVEIDDRDIVSADRMGTRGGDGGRPRPLVVRLARRATRSDILRGARVRRGATTDGMGLGGEPCRFYVNERLTKLNRQLFAKAREQARLHGWKYTWTRDGRVYVRRGEGNPAQRIRKEADINNIFDSAVVGSPVDTI